MAKLPAVVQELVTVFGEEVAALEFDVNGTDVTPVVLTEYRVALEAYDRVGAAATESDALTALRDGRAAMVRPPPARTHRHRRTPCVDRFR